MPRDLKPRKHKAIIAEGDKARLSAEAWSYLYPKSRDVYVQLFRDYVFVATVRLRVPR